MKEREMRDMVEKDVEYSIKDLILHTDNEYLTITNEFSSDGIIRFNGKAIGILEFKIKRNFQNERTLAQVYCQAMCYYCKLIEREELDYTKPFYLIVGDDNEVIVINIHQMPNNWILNRKWTSITPSRSYADEELLGISTSMLRITRPIYYRYDDLKELHFGFYLLLGGKI